MAGVSIVIGGFPSTFGEQLEDHYEDVQTKLRKLESIRDRLSLIEEGAGLKPAAEASIRGGGSAVFIVHGRDEGARETVARLVEKLGLEAVILHEQANAGLTLIEKFEKHAGTAGFAVVILTPDDEGRLATEGEDDTGWRPRARQNVIFEAGFFFGALDRRRVVLLYTPGVEKPTDVDGIAWIRLDKEGIWQLKIGKELRNAGFEVDLNRL